MGSCKNPQLQAPARWEKLLSVFVLFFSTNAVIPLFQDDLGLLFNFTRGDIIMRLFLPGFSVIMVSPLLLYFRQLAGAALRDKLLLMLLCFSFCSIAWSKSPTITLQRNLLLFGATVFGIYLAVRYTPREFLKLLIWTLGLSTVISLAFALFLPTISIHHDLQHEGSWRGVYAHKNTFGYLMTLAFFAWLLYSLRCTRPWLRIFIVCGLLFTLLLLSKSMTALTVFFLLPPLLIICYYVRYRYTWAVFLLFLAAVVVIITSSWLFAGLETVFAALGRDITLTGRTYMWEAVWEMIRHHPWLGYGYGAFRSGWDQLPGHLWITTMGPFNAHNGFLELWLQLGLVGLVFFILSFAANFYLAFSILHGKRGPEKMFPLLFLTFVTLYNIPESLLVQNSFIWILYAVISYQLRLNS